MIYKSNKFVSKEYIQGQKDLIEELDKQALKHSKYDTYYVRLSKRWLNKLKKRYE